MSGPFTLSVVGNRVVLIDGAPLVPPNTKILALAQITPEILTLVNAGVLSSSPPIPTDPDTIAEINSHVSGQTPSQLEIFAGVAGPVIDADINAGAEIDYVHGLGSNFVTLAGAIQKRDSSGNVLDSLVTPSQYSPLGIQVQYVVRDADTIRIKNPSAFKVHVKAKAVKY